MPGCDSNAHWQRIYLCVHFLPVLCVMSSPHIPIWKLTVFRYFPLLVFSVIVLTLITAGIIVDYFPKLALVISTVLLICTVAYYCYFLYNFTKLVDHDPKIAFLYEIYSLWGIIVFGLLSFWIFALFGTALDHAYPDLVFHGTSFWSVLIQILLQLADTIAAGLPAVFDTNVTALSERWLGLKFATPVEIGQLGKAYIWGASVLFKVSLVASIVQTWEHHRNRERALNEIFGYAEKAKPAIYVSPELIREIYRKFSRETNCNSDVEREILERLRESTSKEACDLLLLIHNNTKNPEIRSECEKRLKFVKERRIWTIQNGTRGTKRKRRLSY